jgi:hypothetical protein
MLNITKVSETVYVHANYLGVSFSQENNAWSNPGKVCPAPEWISQDMPEASWIGETNREIIMC